MEENNKRQKWLDVNAQQFPFPNDLTDPSFQSLNYIQIELKQIGVDSTGRRGDI